MSSYRLGTITVQDEEAGSLVLDGDGFAAAGELSTLLTSPAIHRVFDFSEQNTNAAAALVEQYRAALGRVYGDGHWRPPSADPRAGAARARLAAGAVQLLGKDRFERLQRLSWRILDGAALVDDEVAGLLKLTPAQRSAIARMAEQAEADNQQVLRSTSHVRHGRLAGQQSIVDAGRAAGKESDARLLEILTPEQRVRFDQIKAG